MNKPRPYNLTDPLELDRLLRETVAYALVSLKNGTDTEGRKFAYEALCSARDAGFVLMPAPRLLETTNNGDCMANEGRIEVSDEISGADDKSVLDTLGPNDAAVIIKERDDGKVEFQLLLPQMKEKGLVPESVLVASAFATLAKSDYPLFESVVRTFYKTYPPSQPT